MGERRELTGVRTVIAARGMPHDEFRGAVAVAAGDPSNRIT